MVAHPLPSLTPLHSCTLHFPDVLAQMHAPACRIGACQQSIKDLNHSLIFEIVASGSVISATYPCTNLYLPHAA